PRITTRPPPRILTTTKNKYLHGYAPLPTPLDGGLLPRVHCPPRGQHGVHHPDVVHGALCCPTIQCQRHRRWLCGQRLRSRRSTGSRAHRQVLRLPRPKTDSHSCVIGLRGLCTVVSGHGSLCAAPTGTCHPRWGFW